MTNKEINNYEEIIEPPKDMVDPTELAAWMLRNYMDDLEKAINKGKEVNPTSDFYVVIHTFRHRVYTNRMYFKRFIQLSCPTPTNNQTVFRYNVTTKDTEYLWTIPDRYHCQEIYDNALDIDPSLKDLKNFVLDYMTGELDKLAKKLNKEDVLNPNVVMKVIEGA